MRDPIAHVDRYLPRSLIERVRTAPPTKIKAPRYVVERRGSCTVYWLGRGSKR